jgi:hypothetical protein
VIGQVDDTVGGIGEGLNAGCWTVALYETSNYMQIDSLEHAKSLVIISQPATILFFTFLLLMPWLRYYCICNVMVGNRVAKN